MHMASIKKLDDEYMCGRTVKVVYGYRHHRLDFAEISHKDNPILYGFPSKGHFLIKVTHALVKTSENVKVYEAADDCGLECHQEIGAPILTDVSMNTVNRQCGIPSAEKKKQIKANQTRPIILELVKTTSIFAKPFQCQRYRKYSYKPHSPRLLKKHPIGGSLQYDTVCNTANAVEISPPIVLFYGHKYQYKMSMETDFRQLLSTDPIMIVNFYGRIYETVHKDFTVDEKFYFAGLSPFAFLKNVTKITPKVYLARYESDVDGYDTDTSDEETENDGSQEKIIKREATKLDLYKIAIRAEELWLGITHIK